MSGPQPTPQPGPTPTPTVSIPQVPSNTYELLSNAADAIDTANGAFNTHATKLANISGETNGAVNNVTSTSTSSATTALSDTWKNTQSNFSNAHDPLTALIASNCMGGNPNPLREALNQNKSAIQNGLTAITNLQAYKQNTLPQTPTAQQVEDWIQQVNDLTNSLGNVNMALQGMLLVIRNMNGGFSASCVTGFSPGQPLPTFNKVAFSSSGGGGGGGDDPAVRQRIINALGGDSGLANIIIDEALGHGISLDSVATLLEKGINIDQVFDWINDGTNLDSIVTLTNDGIDTTRINTWISRGINIDDVAAFVSDGIDADTAVQLTRSGVNPSDVLPLIKEGVSPKTILNMIQSGVSPTKVGSAIEANITNLIKDSNPKFPLTRTNAITMLNGPDGTYPQVAGSGGAGADINFIDPKTGNIVLGREDKSVTTQSGFTSELRSLPDQLGGYSGSTEVVFQVPAGTNAQSWIGGFLKGKSAANLAQYKGLNIEMIAPQGNVLWQGTLTK